MFRKHFEKTQTEKTHVFNLFTLLKDQKELCFVSLEKLSDNNIPVPVIESVLERLGIRSDINGRNFIIYLTKSALADKLDTEYPEEVVEPKAKATEPSQAKATQLPEGATKAQTSSSAAPVGAPVDSLLTRCTSLLESLRSTYPVGGAQPYYSSPEQHSMLVEYLEVAVRGLEISEGETKAQFDARIGKSHSQCNAIKQQFTQRFSAEVACEEFHEVKEVIIFSLLQGPLKAKEEQNKITRICQLFHYPSDYAQTLTTSKARLNQLFAKTQQAAQVIDATRDVLQYLCTRAGLPQDTVQVIPEARIPTSELGTADPLAHLTVHLVGANEAIGYSLHNILLIAGVITDDVYTGNPSRRFEDRASFTLNYQQIKKFQEYISDVSVWYRDFENILSALFDEDAATYVKTGCKPLREAVKTEVVRESKREPLFMTREVRERFSAHASEPFLLFGQAAIDLTTYPHRDAMRGLIQGFYDTNHLTDSKGEPKTFVVDESGRLTFTSLLSIGHIRQIYNEVMAFSTLTKSAKEMGFSLFDYVQIAGEGDSKTLYHTYLRLLLVDIAMSVVPLARGETQTSKRINVERLVGTLLHNPRRDETLYDMYQRFQAATQNLLNQRTDILRAPTAMRAELEPTSEEKLRLLEPVGGRSTSLSSRAFRIESATDLQHVIAHLKACPAYQVASEAYTQYFVSTGAKPIVGAGQAYRRDTIYVHSTLDACIDAIAREFGRRQASDELTIAKEAFLSTVLKMVYAQKMNMPRSAIERVAMRFADVFKVDEGSADLNKGCNTGLSGRILTVESQLIASENTRFMQFNKQLLIDEAETSFNNTLGSSTYGESSMSARYKPLANMALGLQPATTAQLASLNNSRTSLQQFMADLASRYTPGYIYGKCYEYICDDFKRCIRDKDDEEMAVLLGSLGYREDESAQFKIADKWNIKRFEVSLPQHLIETLFSRRILQAGNGQLVIQATAQRFSASAPRESTSSAASGFFQAAPPAAASASSAPPPPWGTGRGLYQPPRAPQPAASVDLRGESKQSQGPGTGSVG